MGIEYLHIETYKGLVNKKLEDLGDVNILVGDNNTCKTTFLEAVKLVGSKNKVSAIYQVAGINDLMNTSYDLIDNLENAFNTSLNKRTGKQINITSNEDRFYMQKRYPAMIAEKKGEFFARINEDFPILINRNGVIEQPNTQIDEDELDDVKFIMPSQNLKYYNHMISNNLLNNSEVFLECIRSFDSEITDLKFVTSEYTDSAVLKLCSKNRDWMNVSNYGDGIQKVILLANAIATLNSGSILLIDEIETSLHVSALEGVYSWLLKVCKEKNIQLFITTHSREALKTLTNLGDEEVDVVVYQLENFENDVYIERIGNETAKRILEKGGDLR